MIQKIKIKNFRGITKGEMDFSPVTILLGANNSAKSTIIEALFLAPNPCRKVPYVNLENKQQYSALEACFYLHLTLDYQGYAFLLHNYTSKRAEITINENEYTLNFIRSDPHIYLKETGIKVKKTEINHVFQEINGVQTRIFAQLSLNSLNFTAWYKRPIFGESLLIPPRLLRPCYEYMRQQWMVIVNSKIARKIAAEASTFSPENYDDFTLEPIIGGRSDINAYLKDGRRIRLGDLGQGIQNYVISRTLYELANPEVLLWDDIESHLNPRMLLHIADWFNEIVERNKQIIISTHSLEAAKVVAGVNEEHTQIYMTSLEESRLRTKKLTLDDLEKLQKAGIDPRTAEAFL